MYSFFSCSVIGRSLISPSFPGFLLPHVFLLFLLRHWSLSHLSILPWFLLQLVQVDWLVLLLIGHLEKGLEVDGGWSVLCHLLSSPPRLLLLPLPLRPALPLLLLLLLLLRLCSTQVA